MCRLYGFKGNEPTKVECTLVRAQNALLAQSIRDRRGMAHADGWGIAVYEDGSPEIERRSTSAHGDTHFSVAAERVFASTVVAHVRQATVGGASPGNTHPFTHGRWTFAHNGTVRGFPALEAQLVEETEAGLLAERQGTTDSEMAFLWLMSRFLEAGVDLDEPCYESLVETFGRSVRLLAGRCRVAAPELVEGLNFLLTDGKMLAVSRWHRGLSFVAREGVHDCEVCGIPHVHHDPDAEYRAVVVASEAISHEPWAEVPDEHILFVGPSIEHELIAI